jgi:hypothetical protein
MCRLSSGLSRSLRTPNRVRRQGHPLCLVHVIAHSDFFCPIWRPSATPANGSRMK